MRRSCIAALSLLALFAGCRSVIETPPAEVAAEVPSAGSPRTRLLSYLRSLSGKAIVSGQMNLTWNQGVDMAARVRGTTGRYPALQGFDFMNYVGKSGRRSDADRQTSLAKAWWLDAAGTGKNGIVAFTWHWRDPSRLTDSFYRSGSSKDGGAHQSMRIPLDAAGNFDPTTTIGAQMAADMDFIAGQLLELKKAGVPVLWRPLHEGAGNAWGAWFWWGQDGAKAYVALWRWMYARFADKGLDNLVWVWNGQSQAFYPGDPYVDAGGQDVYEKNHSSQAGWYRTLRSWIGPTKLVALTEVGAMPDPANIARDGAWYSWFMVWNDSPFVDAAHAEDNFWSGSGLPEETAANYPWNAPSFARRVYGDARVITLDEVADLR